MRNIVVAIISALLLACGGGKTQETTSQAGFGHFRALAAKAAPVQKGILPAQPTGKTVDRYGGSAIALPNGNVFVSGGSSTNMHQVFDLVTETFTDIASEANILRKSPTLLPYEGKVLILGGNAQEIEVFDGESVKLLSSKIPITAEMPWGKLGEKFALFPVGEEWLVFDPVTLESEAKKYPGGYTGDFSVVRNGEGKPFIVGGFHAEDGRAVPNMEVLTVDENGEIAVVGKMNIGRRIIAAQFINAEEIAIYGGMDGDGIERNSLVEVFNTSTGTMRKAGNLPIAIAGSGAAMLQNGYALIAGGGIGFNGGLTDLEQVFDHATGISGFTKPMMRKRAFPTMATLPNGRVLIIGGEGLNGAEVVDPIAEIFEPESAIYIKMASLEPVPLGESITLTAEGSGEISWATNQGAISSSGVFTAPENASVSQAEVTASNASGSAKAFIHLDREPLKVKSETLVDGRIQFTATVNWFADKAINWSCEGGAIDGNGLLVIDPGAKSVKVTAVLAARPKWTVTLTVK